MVTDDADRENEGDLIMAAQHMTPEKMHFMVRHHAAFVGGTATSLACTAAAAQQNISRLAGVFFYVGDARMELARRFCSAQWNADIRSCSVRQRQNRV